MDNVKKVNDIMVRLFNVVLKIEEQALKESSMHNLSITEMHTLDAIGMNKEKTMSEVAASLNINLSTLTSAINKLVKKEYVTRFRSKNDRRIVKIKLTPGGEAAVLEHERFHNEMIKNAIGKLSEEEIENFIGSLDNINQFMDMQAVKPIREEKDFSLGPINLGKTIIPVGIVQGGMGIGVSLHGLASAVALQGGMGVIGAADIGFREENYGENPKEANKTALRREIKQALALVAQAEQRGPIGVNIPYRLEDYREYVETAIDAGAEVIISGAGLPMTLPGIPKAKKVALIPVVSSVRAARLILKNWRKKHDRIPDAFIFENAFAGGQLGYKESELGRAKANYFKTITEIKNEIGDCPLIVGGGIYNRDGAKKAFLYGADGIQMGSRFVTTKECDIHDAFKKVYLNGKENDVTIVKSPSGILCRAMKNQSIDLQQGELKEELNGALLKAARGDMEHGLVFCGSKAYKAKKLDTVAAVFEEFI